MRLRRGDIALVLFPDPNLRTAKRRPVLVVQRDDLGTGLDQVVVAMISSNMARSGHPSRVEVLRATPGRRASGLMMDSVVMADNLATVLESEFDRVVGRWPDMAAVDRALCHTLGLPADNQDP